MIECEKKVQRVFFLVRLKKDILYTYFVVIFFVVLRFFSLKFIEKCEVKNKFADYIPTEKISPCNLTFVYIHSRTIRNDLYTHTER